MLRSIDYHNFDISARSSNSSLPPNQTFDLGSWFRSFLLQQDYQLGETIFGNKICICIELDYGYEPNVDGSVVFKLTDSDLIIRGIFTEDSMKTCTDSTDSQESDSFRSKFDLSQSLICLKEFKLIHIFLPGKTHGDFVFEVMDFVSTQNAETRADIQEQLNASSQFTWCSEDPEIQALLIRITLNRAKYMVNFLCLSDSLKSTFDDFNKTQSTVGIFYIPPEVKAHYKLDKPGTYVYGEDLQTKKTVPAQPNFDEVIIIDEDDGEDTINPKRISSAEELMANAAANKKSSCFNKIKKLNHDMLLNDQTNSINTSVKSLRNDISVATKKTFLSKPITCPQNIEKDHSLLIKDLNYIPTVCDIDQGKVNYDVQLVLHQISPADILKHQNQKKRQTPKTYTPRRLKKMKCDDNVDAISKSGTSFKTKGSKTNPTMTISLIKPAVLNQTVHTNRNDMNRKNVLSVVPVPPISDTYDPVLKTMLTESQISSPLTDSMEVIPSQDFDWNDFLATHYPSYKHKKHTAVKPSPHLDKSKKQQKTWKLSADVVLTTVNQKPSLGNSKKQLMISKPCVSIIPKPCVSIIPKPSSSFECEFASYISKQKTVTIFPKQFKENTKPEINRLKMILNSDIFSEPTRKNTRRNVTPASKVVNNSDFFSDNLRTPTQNKDLKEFVSASTITTAACLPLKQTNSPSLDSEIEVVAETNPISSSFSQKIISGISVEEKPVKRNCCTVKKVPTVTRPISRRPKKVTNTRNVVFTQIKPHPKNEHFNIIPNSRNQEGKHSPVLKVSPLLNNSSKSAIELEGEPSASNRPLSADTNKCLSLVQKVTSVLNCDEMGLNISTEPKMIGGVSKAFVKCTTKEADTETLTLGVPEIITSEEPVEDFITIFDSESNDDFPMLKFSESDSDSPILPTDSFVHQTRIHNMREGFCPWKIDTEHLMKIWLYSSENRS